MKMFSTLGLAAVFGVSFGQVASADGIGGTSWDLLGLVSGKVGVSCRVGPRNVGAAVTTKRFFQSNDVDGDRKLDARIVFGAGTTQMDGSITGVFDWSNDELSAMLSTTLTGTWRQEGNAITLKFDDWAVSPIAVGATAMARGFAAIAGNSYTQGDATLSIHNTNDFADNVKYVFTGRVNPNGSSLKISEVFGFGFSATGSAGGFSNTCTFRISNFGRTYKGTPSVQP